MEVKNRVIKLENKQVEKFFKTSNEVMIVPDTDTKGNFLNKYLLIDRKHYLECKDKDPVNCDMFNMDRETLKKGDNEFKLSINEEPWTGNIKIKVNDRFLTLEYKENHLRGWVPTRTSIYKESLKMNRYYNSDYYGVYLTPFWYEKLSRLEIIK